MNYKGEITMSKVTFNEILDTKITNTKTIKVNKTFIDVKTIITTDEFVAFVNTVTDLAFDENGMYNGAFERIAVRYAVVKLLTNIDIEDMTVNNVFDCTFQKWFTNVMDVVETSSYWDELMGAVYDNIARKTEISIRSRKTSFDNLCDTLTDIIKDFSEYNNPETIDALKRIAEKINIANNDELVEAISAHAKKTADEQKDAEENG